jgi:hypothetical protein
MAPYILRDRQNSRALLHIIDNLLHIYETQSPEQFKHTLFNVELHIYDKIIDLSASKSPAKTWTSHYTECVLKSKKLMVLLHKAEAEEAKNYSKCVNTYLSSSEGRPYIQYKMPIIIQGNQAEKDYMDSYFQ